MINYELTRQPVADYIATKCWIYLSADHNSPEDGNEPPKHWSVDKRVYTFDTYGRAIIRRYELKVTRNTADSEPPTELGTKRFGQPLVDRESPL